MIELRNFTKYYGKTKAVEDVSLVVKDRSTACLLGRNGAGKTTILKAACGIHYPTSGNIFVNGINVVEESLKAKQIVGYAAENPVFPMNYTVKEFLNSTVNLRCYFMSQKDKKQRLSEVLERFSLADVKSKKINDLSKGYKQRLILAGALAADPDILILDEPTSGLDPVQIQEKRELIKDLAATKTILISTHSMNEAELLCSDVFIINDGRLVAGGSCSDVKVQYNAATLEEAFMASIRKV